MKTNKKTETNSRKKSAAPTRATDVRGNDPHLEREQSRYEHPLPSREYILQVLLEQGVPVSEDRLAQLLGVAPHEMDTFVRRLAAMERSGQIMRNRKNAICVV
jgi:ribonuclease R